MATKDWKKETGKNAWSRRDEDTQHDFIDLEIFNPCVDTARKAKVYVILVWQDSNGKNKEKPISFKSKSLALKFAHRYMRTH